MKSAIIVLALLIAGCGEQAVEKQEPMTEFAVRFKAVDIPDGAVVDSARIWVKVYDYEFEPDSLIEGCGQVRDFAAWCQKAHPEVWREYHATHTGGE